MKKQIALGVSLGLTILTLAATRYVTVDDTQPMPWTTIANSTNYATLEQGVKADAALPKSATNALVVTALQITSGSPTNGAVFVATNNAGQGAWVVYPKIDLQRAGYTSSVAWQVVSMPTVNNQTGGTWDGTDWTPGVIGYISAFCSLRITSSMIIDISIYKNRGAMFSDPGITGSTSMRSFLWFNSSATNKYSVAIYTDTIATNNISFPMRCVMGVVP